MTKKIISMAMLCMVLSIQISAQSYRSSSGVSDGIRLIPFSGSYKGRANMSNYFITLQNNGGSITGRFLIGASEVFQVKGQVNDLNIVYAKFKGNDVTFDCTLYHNGERLIVEMDKNFIATVKLLLVLAGEVEAAQAIEDTIVMSPSEQR